MGRDEVKRPMNNRLFMRAHWHHVLSLTYPVDEKLLLPYLPSGARISELKGSPRVSLVAFGFKDTRVKGIKIPLHVNFPEINLRFYVEVEGKRAVVFIREFVPRPAISLVAKGIFNEPYKTILMKMNIEDRKSEVRVSHSFKGNMIQANLSSILSVPDTNSPEYWLTHHELGVGRSHSGETQLYKVKHPVWELYNIKTLDWKVDFKSLYGKEWEFLNTLEPSHTTVARGSEVEVFLPER